MAGPENIKTLHINSLVSLYKILQYICWDNVSLNQYQQNT